jgi:hypothetical protein
VTEEPQSNRAVVVYTAGSQSEAAVIRGLLESAGVPLPGPVSPDPFPLIDAAWSRGSTHGVEIYAFEPQAEEARRIIEEYLNRPDRDPDPNEDRDEEEKQA